MTDGNVIRETIADLLAAEIHLLRMHRIRLRVDKVTPDGRNAICSAAQVQSRFLRMDYSAEQGIAACHTALSSLHRMGINPLVGWSTRAHAMTFILIVPNDPFGLCKALKAAGMDQPVLSAELSVVPVQQEQYIG